jgi:hypothetical protein
MRAGESCRILLVDDHAAVRHGLALSPKKASASALRPPGGRRRSAAFPERPDLALVDLAPGTDDVLEVVADLFVLHGRTPGARPYPSSCSSA